jgi:membrane protease YdiL (CAAX protease family)
MVPLGPDGVLETVGAPRTVIHAIQRAVVFRGKVTYAHALLSSLRPYGDPRAVRVEYAFFGGELVTVVSYAILFAVAFAWLRSRALDPRELFRLTRAGAAWTARIALVAAGTALAIGGVVGAVAAAVDDGRPLRAFLDGLDLPLLQAPGGSLVVSATMILLAPFAEEITFRGVLYRFFKKYVPTPFAAAFQAALFAAYHLGTGWSPALLPLQYAFALLAAYAVERTGSLASGVILHALGNTAALLFIALVLAFPEAVLTLFTL